jgi:ubiquinone/menaquinone biosynthesis C-methylase UbiE
VSDRPPGWRLFERDAAGYEAWYATRRGRRADRAERALLARLLAPFASAQSAIEIGCGTGHFTRWLATRVPRVVGLDAAPSMLAEAARHRPRLRLVRGDAGDLPFRDRAVDVSLFVLAIEFVDDPARALAEAVRASRRGVLVVALNRWSPGGFSRRWGRDARRPLLGQARDFTLARLRALLATAAGPRLGALRWASTLFPDGLAGVVARVPLGGVIGIAADLTP